MLLVSVTSDCLRGCLCLLVSVTCACLGDGVICSPVLFLRASVAVFFSYRALMYV